MTDNRSQRSKRDDRAAPHNLDAEAAVLGAMLLSVDAARVAVTDITLDAGDYYKPGHQHIHNAISAFVRIGIPHDVLLVADELRCDDLLDIVGGMEYLLQLTNATPSISNVGRYAKIVRDTATMRRLLTTATEITNIAYSEPDDIVTAIGGAEALVLKLLDSVADTALPFVDMAAVLAGSLEPIQPSILYRSDGKALIYSARLNVLQGSPASGKTWVSRMAAKQVIDGGGHVMILDWEDTAQAFVAGLLALGALPSDIVKFVHFLKPDSSVTIARILKSVKQLGIELLIIDSVAEALNFCGFSEDKPDEYLAWLAQLPRQAANAGATVIMLDHIVKSKDEQGFWARGTGAKLGACDGATYNVKSSGFNQTTAGNIYLTVAKDRPGGLPARQGEKAAKIWMNPSDGGRIVQALIEIPPPEPTSKAGVDKKDQDLADKREALANRILEVLDEPLGRRDLAGKARSKIGSGPVRFSDPVLDSVLVDLLDGRKIVRTAAPRGATIYSLPPRQQRLSMDQDES